MAKDKLYTEAVGRRKTASARVRISESKNATMIVNGKDAADYFPLEQMVKTAFSPMQVLGATYAVTVVVKGGGHKAQADAVRHGLSRAINELVPEQRKDLKIRGFLKRDPRAKERKKFGLVAARRAPQWSKR